MQSDNNPMLKVEHVNTYIGKNKIVRGASFNIKAG